MLTFLTYAAALANQKYVYFRLANFFLIHSIMLREKLESESATQGIRKESEIQNQLIFLRIAIPEYNGEK